MGHCPGHCPGLSTNTTSKSYPRRSMNRDPLWNLGSQVYRQCEVLNSRIEKNLVLRRGEIAEGWLLATGIAPIPAQYSNSAVVPLQLTFWDQFGDEIVAQRGDTPCYGKCSGTTRECGRVLDCTDWTQPVSPGSSPSKKTRAADIWSYLPRKRLLSSKGSRDGRRFVVIGGVRFRLGIANAVLP
jgi:hypothetical protein